MAHFAKLDSNNIVTQVVVVDNYVLLNDDNTESESNGVNHLNNIFGNSNWKQTSYNGTFRKNYAGRGYKYDSARDAFIPPKPYDSWTLNETTCRWDAPVAYPSDNNHYTWNEDDQQWDQIT